MLSEYGHGIRLSCSSRILHSSNICNEGIQSKMKLYKTDSEGGKEKPSESATLAHEDVPEC